MKELAKQTAKATEEIGHKITAIQANTNGAVEAINSIRTVIDKISHISGVIATAVEEQSATTNEMSRNVGEAAKGAGEISHNIAGVAEAAQSTSNSVAESQKATEHLAEMSQALTQIRKLYPKLPVIMFSTLSARCLRHAGGSGSRCDRLCCQTHQQRRPSGGARAGAARAHCQDPCVTSSRAAAASGCSPSSGEPASHLAPYRHRCHRHVDGRPECFGRSDSKVAGQFPGSDRGRPAHASSVHPATGEAF